MLNILIVEDDAISAKMLSKILANLGHCVVGIVKNAEKAILSVQEVKPDLVFMDIDLEGTMNGILTADILTGYYSLNIVFVSIHADFQTRTLAVGKGMGYIVKPFTTENIENAIKSLDIKINQSHSIFAIPAVEKIQVRHEDQFVFINLYDIYFIEAQNHYVKIHTKLNEYLTRGKLEKYKESDKKNRFIIPHRSFLVNADCIEALSIKNRTEYSIIMKDIKRFVPISRNKISEIKSLISEMPISI